MEIECKALCLLSQVSGDIMSWKSKGAVIHEGHHTQGLKFNPTVEVNCC